MQYRRVIVLDTTGTTYTLYEREKRKKTKKQIKKKRKNQKRKKYRSRPHAEDVWQTMINNTERAITGDHS